MPSDPSYGTTGFFSYLWVRRKPVYDADFSNVTFLTSDVGQLTLTADDGTTVLTTDAGSIPTDRLIRWI